MGYQYEEIDGERVEVHVAAAFKNMAAAFKRQFNLTLHVRSGTRTRAEQEHLYKEYLAGRIVQAAKPGSSNHEEDGPRGPRALDLYDSGADAGVKYAGTVRSNWLSRVAPRFGFDCAGLRFRNVEAWHYEYTGSLSDVVYSKAVEERQKWLNANRGEHLTVDGIQGRETTAAFERYQTYLKSRGWYRGQIDGKWGSLTESAHQTFVRELKAKAEEVIKAQNPFGLGDVIGLQKISRLYGGKTELDNKWGPESQKGFAEFLRQKYGYKGNDVLGPVMWAAIANWLRKRWDYKGDDVYGPVMKGRLAYANQRNKVEL